MRGAELGQVSVGVAERIPVVLVTVFVQLLTQRVAQMRNASGGVPPARSLGIASLCALDTLAHGKARRRGRGQASELLLNLVERQAGAA